MAPNQQNLTNRFNIDSGITPRKLEIRNFAIFAIPTQQNKANGMSIKNGKFNPSKPPNIPNNITTGPIRGPNIHAVCIQQIPISAILVCELKCLKMGSQGFEP